MSRFLFLVGSIVAAALGYVTTDEYGLHGAPFLAAVAFAIVAVFLLVVSLTPGYD